MQVATEYIAMIVLGNGLLLVLVSGGWFGACLGAGLIGKKSANAAFPLARNVNPLNGIAILSS